MRGRTPNCMCPLYSEDDVVNADLSLAGKLLTCMEAGIMASRGHRPQTVARSGAVLVPTLTDAVKRSNARAAGQHGVLAAPSPEAVRKFIEAQTCPWCGAGPWQMLAGHTSKQHGVSAAELRELAGLIKAAAICSDTHHASTQERNRKRGVPTAAIAALRDNRPGRTPRTFSSAGRAAQRAKLEKARTAVRQADDEREHPEADLEVKGSRPEARPRRHSWTSEEIAAKARATRLANMQPRYDEILALWDSGLMLAEVAERARVSPITARRVIRRERDNPDMLGRRNESARWRSGATAGLRKGHETRARIMDAERAALRVDFEDAGGTWEALVALAKSRNVQVKHLKRRLLKTGALVPDGRIASPLMGKRQS